MAGVETDGCIINAPVIRDVVARQGLKQWWIAERLQIHRKTVSRWINGTVKRTSREMAEALAEVLGATVEEITVADEADLFATDADHKAAAHLLRRSTLLDRLGPIGEWETIEKLLKSALVSGLPPVARADLLNKLSIASWRQSNISVARTYAEKARRIGESTGEKRVLLPALLNLANIASWEGNTRRALSLYETCIREGEYLEPRERAGAMSNYAAVLWEAGDREGCVEPLRRAIELFERHGKPTNLSIAHAQVAMILLESGHYHVAQTHVRSAAAYARQDDYHRGTALSTLLQAELDARSSRSESARDNVRKALQEFADLGIAEGQSFEIGSRVLRILGAVERAEVLADRGIAAARDFPMEKAALERERALIRIAQSKVPEAIRACHRARDLYARCGAELRVREVDALLRQLDQSGNIPPTVREHRAAENGRRHEQ